MAYSLGYHLDECQLVALMLVPFLKIKNLVVLTHVTYISVKLHLVKCTNQSLIQVISLTGICWIFHIEYVELILLFERNFSSLLHI